MDKARSGERMKLGAFFHSTGNHVAAWLHPDAQILGLLPGDFKHAPALRPIAKGDASQVRSGLPAGGGSHERTRLQTPNSLVTG